MSLTPEAREYMAKRETLSENETNMIDDAFRSLYANSKHYGIPAATDDRAAELEAAMIKFIIDSRKKG